MKNSKLRIGRIPYANLFPVYYYLDSECNSPEYRFIKGVPSKLNNMLRSGELDISPSSSIEYLRNQDKYQILPSLSVSSTGPIRSILLFSSLPIEELGGETIALSSESETSVALLKVILTRFFSLTCRFEYTSLSSVKNILSRVSAVLHIGDTAMSEAQKLSSTTPHSSPLYTYDLGELWDRHTGLPFVYALWLVRKESLSEKSRLIRQLSSDLLDAKEYTRRKYPFIAGKAPQKKWISVQDLVQYWKIISYDLTKKHMEGLKLFEKYAKKIEP